MPIVIWPRMVAPASITTSSSTIGWRGCPLSRGPFPSGGKDLLSRVTAWCGFTRSPITAVPPIITPVPFVTPVAWSIKSWLRSPPRAASPILTCSRNECRQASSVGPTKESVVAPGNPSSARSGSACRVGELGPPGTPQGGRAPGPGAAAPGGASAAMAVATFPQAAQEGHQLVENPTVWAQGTRPCSCKAFTFKPYSAQGTRAEIGM